MSPVFRRFVDGLNSGSLIQHMYTHDLDRCWMPVPPPSDQRAVVPEVERQFSFIEACERAVEAGLARAAALRRSILAAAFSGKLVPQDPSDEPASLLLERIRAERQKAVTQTRPRARRGATRAAGK